MIFMLMNRVNLGPVHCFFDTVFKKKTNLIIAYLKN